MEVKGFNGTVSFDGNMVVIARTDLRARLTMGKGDKRIPLSKISATQWKPAGALTQGYIQFAYSGSSEVRSKGRSQTKDALKDENSVVFSKKQEPGFIELREVIDAAINNQHNSVTSGSSQNFISVADELKKLADLRAAGVLTDEDFAEQKARLLG